MPEFQRNMRRSFLRSETNLTGIDDAKKYIYSFSTRRRVYKWVDLNVSVWV